jgi:hypothetical protein
MTRRFLVSEVGRIDRVTAVIIPMDGATRVPVRTGVEVQLWDADREQAQSTRLIRNLSGQWVLLNNSPDQDLVFRIVTERSCYRGPILTTFNPERERRPDHIVSLERRPDASFDDISTLVRGAVVQRDMSGRGETVPQEGVKVSATGAKVAGHQFPVSTDKRGTFALIVNIRSPGPDEPPRVQARMRFEKEGMPPRNLNVSLKHGMTHVFSVPIDLAETNHIKFRHE